MSNLDPNILFPVGLSVMLVVWSFTIVQAYKAVRARDALKRRRIGR